MRCEIDHLPHFKNALPYLPIRSRMILSVIVFAFEVYVDDLVNYTF